jgi:hypothetical protein
MKCWATPIALSAAVDEFWGKARVLRDDKWFASLTLQFCKFGFAAFQRELANCSNIVLKNS